ncbi:HsdM family class I SAM-dependent methyltransferase [Ktedonobacter robiniae]|uniref:site-specific DNA-methyltransferase (adenine-specific) n=1 Tax=Ktedonobacter robiniae TaxID=2778365 RepID=A0ABQ3UTQ7_9CHLR|nr:N-6 DNA methylase [Ktedonobacter robiniae]GHO56078.1 DNA methyltransferase [Ktedonobacter robiniae]
MRKIPVHAFIHEATQLLKADSTGIISNKDIVKQLAWLLFLKHLDKPGNGQELFASQKQEGWHYSWSTWVPRVLQQGATHFEECRRSLREELHPLLGKLFGLKSEYMEINKKFEIFQRLIQLIDEAEFISKSGEDCIAQLYSALLALLAEEDKKKGIFATPPAITRFMVQILDPGSEDIVYDPACGTGDFLLAAERHCTQKKDAIDTNRLYGRDSVEEVVQLARMNMLLHGINAEQVQQQAVESALRIEDTLNRPLFYLNGEVPDASVIMMHPPLGRYSSKAKDAHSPKSSVSFDCYEAWFLQHSWRKMQGYTAYARCGMVVSSAILDGREKQKIQLRKEILQKWNILMVVWLPEIAFSPTSSERTFLLFFDKRPLTKKILHYNLASRLGNRTYTYTESIQDSDFAEILETWKHWKAHLESPEQIQEPDQTEFRWIMRYDPQTFDWLPAHDPYTLLPLPPSTPSQEEQLSPDELLRQIEKNHLQQRQHIQRLQELLSRFSKEGNNV